MGKFKFLLLFAMLGIISLGYGQQKISYDDHSVLTWEDFKGEPVFDSEFHANTNSGFSYSWSYKTSNGEVDLQYEVYSTFYPNGSWVHPDYKTEKLLKHEQAHFDISEIHARKLRKAMQAYTPGRSIRKDLQKLYNDIELQRVEMQGEFDLESAHSMNLEAEQKWQLRIAKELEKLKDYTKK
jgi:hypothetical protein